MNPQTEILDAVQILIDKAMENMTQIYNGTVTGANGRYCSMLINGVSYSSILFYGNTPTVNAQYRVFVPEGNMSQAFIIVP